MSMTSEHDRRSAVLRDLEHSGLSMAEYCRRAGLTYSTVAAWRAAQRREDATRFIEVDTGEAAAEAVPPAPARAAVLCAELALPGGMVLRVYHRGAEGGAL